MFPSPLLEIATAIYVLISLAFLLTFITQLKLIRKNPENGLANLRYALTTIVFVYFIDALFVLFSFLSILWIPPANVIFSGFLFGVIFILIKSLVAIGAWMYVAIYYQKLDIVKSVIGLVIRKKS
jgi:hypothetical protein